MDGPNPETFSAGYTFHGVHEMSFSAVYNALDTSAKLPSDGTGDPQYEILSGARSFILVAVLFVHHMVQQVRDIAALHIVRLLPPRIGWIHRVRGAYIVWSTESLQDRFNTPIVLRGDVEHHCGAIFGDIGLG
ncbi:uncharacterized protein N7459_004698 [Penicillium hispanicum]|uniref:uncharacterized protein n=1 Tax=Penicillium hispanicum TaxID=1080232 RepID=UPI0025403302|nr:uncharacterized protein N7459_004698 [Penicillium hispanicum]KAJ5584898.1 hypothetical protein N7459_004698 [Penicillium hispanicum]